MKCIYIAGKLNADAVGYLKNVHNMIVFADMVRKMGYAVLIPCLDLLSGIVFGNYEYEDYFNNNSHWLLKADAVLVLPDSENSKGTAKEILLAGTHNIPVFTSLQALKACIPPQRI
jgi:hypothetical protein